MNMELKPFKDVEQVVFECLRDFPETRDNTKKLMLKVWERQGLRLTDQQTYFFLKCYSSESITRAGRMWQNDKCLFKGKNDQQDMFMEREYRDHYRKP